MFVGSRSFSKNDNKNLKSKKMKNIKIAYFLLVASLILLIINIYNLDLDNFRNENYWGILSNLLLMFGMIINIRDLKKPKK